MILRTSLAVSLILLIVCMTIRPAEADDFMESWYLSRGRSNMEIGNYKAAIEAFEKVVERDPNHREALRSLGLAYERQGLKDKSIETFDQYLARYDDDPEIAFKQAQALEWSRYFSYREKDVLKYYRLGLSRKDDPAMRLKYEWRPAWPGRRRGPAAPPAWRGAAPTARPGAACPPARSPSAPVGPASGPGCRRRWTP